MGGKVTKNNNFDYLYPINVKLADKCDFDLSHPTIELSNLTPEQDIKSINNIIDYFGKPDYNEYFDKEFNKIHNINVLNEKLSIVKSCICNMNNTRKIEFIKKLINKGYNFKAKINEGWETYLFHFKIMDVIRKDPEIYNLLGYGKIYVALHFEDESIDIDNFTEEEIIKALTKVDEKHITNIKLFAELIKVVNNKKQITNKIKYINMKRIQIAESYDEFTDEEKNLYIESGAKINKKLVESMKRVSDKARNMIFRSSYRYLDFDNPNFSNKFILHLFAETNNIKLFKKYLDVCDVDEKDAHNNTPAMIASKKGYIDILQIIQAHRNQDINLQLI
jgi:hypothetical protein